MLNFLINQYVVNWLVFILFVSLVRLVEFFGEVGFFSMVVFRYQNVVQTPLCSLDREKECLQGSKRRCWVHGQSTVESLQ